MSVIESPTNPLIQAQVDSTYLALRTNLLPREWQAAMHPGGHHKMSIRTGNVTGVAAAGPIFSMRWANTQFNMILQRLSVTATIGTVFAAAQELSLDLVRLINFSAQDTGGTAIDPLLKATIKDTQMAVSQMSSLRVAAAGALTLGTGTVDSASGGSAIAEETFPLSTTTVGSTAKIDLFDMRPGEQSPFVFRSNEGFRVRILQAMGAGGVVVFHFNMEWAEVPNQQ